MYLIPLKVLLTQSQKKLKLDSEENLCFLNFLAGKNEEIVKLNRLLGIGGEGLVLHDEVWTSKCHYRDKLKKIEKKKVAVKFVKFEKNDDDDFDAPEEPDKYGDFGGINENGSFVTSKYFRKMFDELGDFAAAIQLTGGYVTPFADFAISEIYKKNYFVIGEPNFQFKKTSCL